MGSPLASCGSTRWHPMYGVVNNRRAVVAVQDPYPNASVTVLTGATRVDAIVTVGFWVHLSNEHYRYVKLPDFRLIESATGTLFPIQSAEDEMGIEPDLRRSKCMLRFPDGAVARFSRLMRSGQRGGYPLQVWY